MDNARLLALGKLWVTVHYFHPYIALHGVDWDSAFIEAFPKLKAARSREEYRSAAGELLDRLGDPGTFVLPDETGTGESSIQYDRPAPHVLVVSEKAGAATRDDDSVHKLAANAASANRIVFDLRTGQAGSHMLADLLTESPVQESIAPGGFETPGQLSVVHNGLTPEDGHPSPFHTAFYVANGRRLPVNTSRNISETRARSVAFIIDDTSTVPDFAYALAASGKASLIATSTHYRIGGTRSVEIPLGDGVTALVRLSEPVSSNGSGLLQASVVPAANALETAVHGNPMASANPRAQPLSMVPQFAPTSSGDTNPYPTEAARVLAAFKTWGAFRYFFAYKDLMDEDWDDVFASCLPKIAQAKTALDYHLAIAAMVAHLGDSQATVESDTLEDYFGRAPVGLRLAFVGKKVVVSEVLDPEAKKAGISAGDILTKLDGEDVAGRVNREAQYVSYSTLDWLRYRMAQLILRGPEGSTVSLEFSGPNQELKTATLKRTNAFAARLNQQRTGEKLRILPGNIGYADLDRFKPEDVDSMFEKFRNTKAIMFDLRGTEGGTADMIAPRLTDEHDVASAIVTGPIAMNPDLTSSATLTKTASYFEVQKLPESSKWKYKGKTVFLIDGRTIGAAEQLGLFAEVANKAEFIGSPSAGANSVLTSFFLPGGITVSLSGEDIRHANGGKLQRVGLEPAVSVVPTPAGIRNGRDEVFDKAASYLTGGEDAKRIASSGGTQSRQVSGRATSSSDLRSAFTPKSSSTTPPAHITAPPAT